MTIVQNTLINTRSHTHITHTTGFLLTFSGYLLHHHSNIYSIVCNTLTCWLALSTKPHYSNTVPSNESKSMTKNGTQMINRLFLSNTVNRKKTIQNTVTISSWCFCMVLLIVLGSLKEKHKTVESELVSKCYYIKVLYEDVIEN